MPVQYCKHTDNFAEIVERFNERYPEFRGNISFMVNGTIINENISLIPKNFCNTIITFIMSN